MSKRNLILLIIVLMLITAGIFGYLYFYQPKDQTGNTSESTNFFDNFLPFGKSEDTKPTDANSPVDVSGFEPTGDNIVIQNGKLKKVSSFEIAGYGLFIKERFKNVPDVVVEPQVEIENEKPTPPATEFVTALRYVNKATGNIYQTFADRIDERKFSSTIIPRVYEAFFGNKGESVVMRYLKQDNRTIETFSGALVKEYLGADSVGTSEIKGSFLPENISDISVSPDASKIFYIFNSGENAVGITYDLSTNTKVQVFDSPFTEWLSFWPSNKTITVTTKPSYNTPGYMYSINTDRKDFDRVLGGINGLTTLTSPDGKKVLYANNNLSLNIFNIDTNNSDLISIKTLPEKCVWGAQSDILYCFVPKFLNQSQYPDSWYQGEVSFSDEIWKINIESGNTILIIDPSEVEGGESIDGVKLNLDLNEDYLFFINKKDSHLWELNLK